ncbi:MAG: hypothetical protein A2X49_05685 [Lentisphaerae bacterium GWF2_52_8]|nr:MAG: hypothetical protein A2X49_05685 [Lentisphaerae bacterium GWF2_52_8]
MKKPISVQLYSLREESKKDFAKVLERVSSIGYKGVEPAGFYNMTPKEFRSKVESLGMVVSSSHGPWANPENLNEVIDTVGVLGLDIASTGFGPDQFKDMDAIKKTAETVNGMVDKLAKANIKLFMHNHAWEFAMVDGKVAYDHFVKICPKVFFEIDTYWATNFGANDPAEQVAKFKNRTILLHIKDGTFVQGGHMVAVGSSGRMDFKKIIDAADPKLLRWLVVELDSCATDMFEAVEKSYRFLVDNNLGEGNR